MPPSAPPPGPLYRAAWRWHFYAGILTAPFAIFLAITGSIYLWQPQYEAWRYHDLLDVAPAAAPTTPDAQFAAACAAHPHARPQTFTPAPAPGRTSETVLKLKDGDKVTVFVDPSDARVVGELRDSRRFMETIRNLHGTLLAGPAGQLVVELVASWLFVLLLTGLYLWWPRSALTVWGFFLPRLRAGGRTFWRDLHAVTAVWFSLAALFLLSTGMPWTLVGGQWLRVMAAAIGEGSPKETPAVIRRSAIEGWAPPLRAGLAEKIDALASAPPAPPATRLPLVTIIAIADAQSVPKPYAIVLPVGTAGTYGVVTPQARPFARTSLQIDAYTGRVLVDVRYRDYGFMGKFFLWGIVAHEGRLFGLANQILGTLAASGVFLLSAGGLMLWWQRRPTGLINAPASEVALPRPVFFGMLLLALLLPLLAASLIVLALVDRLFERRLQARV